jgi:Amt family ammonium transporter
VKAGLFIRVSLFCLFFAPGQLSSAQTSASSPSASPSLEQRVADLEAYVNNSARGADDANGQTISNITGPGPAHHAWKMTCAALVLFMTLPGLALFYGGLVRAKNVLSILAQCLGIAGLVTIIWWAVGYSLVFSHGSPFIGGLKFSFLRGVDAHPNGD